VNNHHLNGILLLYHHPILPSPPTIMEHVNAFERYSRFKVWKVNTEFGFPKVLDRLQFQIIVLHYSLFGSWPYRLDERFCDYLQRSVSSYKTAFFQDEYRFCQQRFSFINQYDVNHIYTRVRPAYLKDVYHKYTRLRKLTYTLAGYVSDDLIEKAQRITLPPRRRKIDIGYRAYGLPFYMGKGAQEKIEIATGFCERARGLDLKLDIETSVQHRIHGKAWHQFLANCRACLGVEGGVSIFDLEGVVYAEWERIIASNPTITFAEFQQMAGEILQAWENNIPYRSFTPRHFEAAALRVCQILFEGEYSGMMQPMVHYIPLKRDLSNFDDVIRMFKDEALRRELTGNAYRDLIASGQYSYRRFIESFDDRLMKAGLQPGAAVDGVDEVTLFLNRWQSLQRPKKFLRYYPFPGRRKLVSFYKRLLKLYQREVPLS